MHRRTFLRSALCGGTGVALSAAIWRTAQDSAPRDPPSVEIAGPGRPPSFSIIPIVGDGKWIWTNPPEKETGYLEPRPYRVKVGIIMRGTGNARKIMATTHAPMNYAEQKIEDVDISSEGCQAKLRKLKDGAGQLTLYAPTIRAGQTIRAEAEFALTIYKQYHGFHRDQFPYKQEPPRKVRLASLKDSPGIKTSLKEVKALAEQLAQGVEHPWDKALKFQDWIPKNIRARTGPYTSVKAALKNRVGDCEERSAVFVALCRAVGIPARLVWVPNHNWSEIYLHDLKGKGHWIPVHTSCYPWFGWVGAHELVLQKGDRVRVPERHSIFRLMEDWARYVGSKPKIRWTAELIPEPPDEGEDPGPGARLKDAKGEWVLAGNHSMDKYMRR